MKSFIIGTAGHIDHGKTALTKALTGIDADRLPEEKARGISIELGFAPLRFSDDFVVGIVDVPGHERLVKTMVMGATQIDLVLFVVAANEGMMPQSREHLSILKLLGLKDGILVLSKADLLSNEDRQMIMGKIQSELRGTFLEKSAPIFASAKTGEGIEELKQKILEHSQTIDYKNRTEGATRILIDRVFTLPGHGTIVTGPLLSGRLRLEDQLELYPLEKTVRVRQIHAYGKSYSELNAPSRVALNIKGVSKEEIHRGEVLGSPHSLCVTQRATARINFLDHSTRKKGSGHFTIHVGTSRAQVMVRQSEKTGYLKFSKPLVLLPGDRFILRDETTVGGGEIISTSIKRASAKVEKTAVQKRMVVNEALLQKVESFFGEQLDSPEGFDSDWLCKKFLTTKQDIEPLLKLLQSNQKIIKLPGEFYISFGRLEKLRSKLCDFFETHSEMRVVDLKNMFSISRKFAIPYLQFFDEQKWTIRRGDVRVPWKIVEKANG